MRAPTAHRDSRKVAMKIAAIGRLVKTCCRIDGLHDGRSHQLVGHLGGNRTNAEFVKNVQIQESCTKSALICLKLQREKNRIRSGVRFPAYWVSFSSSVLASRFTSVF